MGAAGSLMLIFVRILGLDRCQAEVQMFWLAFLGLKLADGCGFGVVPGVMTWAVVP